MTRPNATDIAGLEPGDSIKINGRQRFTVVGNFGNFVSVEGPRGGHAALVPSICGNRVQVSRAFDKREWIETLEITS